MSPATVPVWLDVVQQSGPVPVGAPPGAWVHAAFLVGLGAIARTTLPSVGLSPGRRVVIVLGTLVTVGASAAVIAGVPTRGYPLVGIALGGQSILWGYAVVSRRFLSRVPAGGRVGVRGVFDELEDGVVTVDGHGTVLRANERANEYLGADGLAGEPLETLLETFGASALADLPEQFQHGGRTYQVNASALPNRHGREVTHALVIQDVTGLITRQQRLQVLNRVLRHDVCNDMNVVLGAAEKITRRGDDEVATLGETIAREAEELATTSKKALEIDRILEQPLDAERVDVGDRVADIVATLADRHPDAAVTVSAEAGEVRTNRLLLSLAVEEVVENALVHAGDSPRITVEATRENGDVRITVRDDGPGIPAAELEPIRSGEETDLQHASGLGLWLVYWSVRALGGDIGIAATGSGTRVSLSIPEFPEEKQAPETAVTA